MNSKTHLTPDRIAALKKGELSTEETIQTLEHIGECIKCANEFAESYDASELLPLPTNFKKGVFSTIDRENLCLAVKEKTRNRKREFYFYSFKVSIAACVTLMLLFSGTFNNNMYFSRTIQENLPEVNAITENLKGFSNKLIDFNFSNIIKEEQ